MLRRLVSSSLCLVCLWVLAGSAAAQERRVALVIGNAAYKTVPLQNPVNDARSVAAALRRLNFEVIERQNLGREGFASVVREFGDRLRGASVGLFYFAGHGLQVRGRNFLVPVDADIAREDEVPYRSFDVNEVLDKMDSARTGVNLVVLDACRNNPFARSFKVAQSGLAQMDAPAGTLIAFATAPGSVAQDGEGGNGLYTGALLKHIATPGLAVEQMFKRVRVDVVAASNSQQVPWESSSLKRDFDFSHPAASASAAPGPVATAPTTGATELTLDLAFWDAVKDSRDAADYRAYLEQYPQGRFAALARLRVNALSHASVRTVAAPGAAGAASLVRWTYGKADKELDLHSGAPVAAMAQSPEGQYLAATSAGSVYWIDAERASVVRSARVYDPSDVPQDLQFSGDGRWLLLGLRGAAESRYQLIDVSSDKVLWERPADSARFDALTAQVLLRSAQTGPQSLRLP